MEEISQRYQAFLFVEQHPDTPPVKKEKKEQHMVQLHTTPATRHPAFNPKGKKQQSVSILFEREVLQRRDVIPGGNLINNRQLLTVFYVLNLRFNKLRINFSGLDLACT